MKKLNYKHLYILTNDDSYYIINEKILINNSVFFKKICSKNSYLGDYSCPIFLQEISGIIFNEILKYLKFYNKDEKEMDENDKITLPKHIARSFHEALDFLQIQKKNELINIG